MPYNIKKVDLNYRISLAETDSVGVVYFANYLMFFEKGHHEYLRQAGINNAELIKTGIYLPIREAHCEYHLPLRYDDLIKIEIMLYDLKKTSLEFHYNIINTNTSETVTSGYTRHLFTNNAFQLIKIPPQIETPLKKFIDF